MTQDEKVFAQQVAAGTAYPYAGEIEQRGFWRGLRDPMVQAQDDQERAFYGRVRQLGPVEKVAEKVAATVLWVIVLAIMWIAIFWV